MIGRVTEQASEASATHSFIALKHPTPPHTHISHHNHHYYKFIIILSKNKNYMQQHIWSRNGLWYQEKANIGERHFSQRMTFIQTLSQKFLFERLSRGDICPWEIQFPWSIEYLLFLCACRNLLFHSEVQLFPTFDNFLEIRPSCDGRGEVWWGQEMVCIDWGEAAPEHWARIFWWSEFLA